MAEPCLIAGVADPAVPHHPHIASPCQRSRPLALENRFPLSVMGISCALTSHRKHRQPPLRDEVPEQRPVQQAPRGLRGVQDKRLLCLREARDLRLHSQAFRYLCCKYYSLF